MFGEMYDYYHWQIPRSSEGKEWFYYTDQSVTLELLEGMGYYGSRVKVKEATK